MKPTDMSQSTTVFHEDVYLNV